MEVPKCRTLAVSGDRLYFITEDEKVGMYYDGECQMVTGVESVAESGIACYDKYAFFISRENEVMGIDMTNLISHELKCFDKSGNRVTGIIYNIKIYDGKKAELYIGKDGEFGWVLCDYDIETGVE